MRYMLLRYCISKVRIIVFAETVILFRPTGEALLIVRATKSLRVTSTVLSFWLFVAVLISILVVKLNYEIFFFLRFSF